MPVLELSASGLELLISVAELLATVSELPATRLSALELEFSGP